MHSCFTILIGLLNTQINTLFVFLFRAEMLMDATFDLIDEVYGFCCLGLFTASITYFNLIKAQVETDVCRIVVRKILG